MTDLTIDERLVVLVEECAEVIHAATKCLRFGWERNEEGYGINKQVLAAEVGDVLGMIDSLPLDGTLVAFNRSDKLRRVEAAKAERSVRIVLADASLVSEERVAELRDEWEKIRRDSNVTVLPVVKVDREREDLQREVNRLNYELERAAQIIADQRHQLGELLEKQRWP